MNVKEPKVMTFDEYLSEYHEYWELEDEITCLECNGSGKVECLECGELTMTCDVCKGEGMTDRKADYKKEYEDLKYEDLKLWNTWVKPLLKMEG